MHMLVGFFSFLVGIFFGSFLNVVIDRFPKKESIVFGRSHCEYCKKTLQWYDLFPLFSYLFLLGRCRYCKKFIGFRYPVIELITGIFFYASFAMASHGVSLWMQLLVFFSYVFIFSNLLCIFCIDLWYEIIPDYFVLPLIVISLLLSLFFGNPPFISAVLSAIGCAGFFLLLYLVTLGKGMGLGDVKLAFFIGLFLGWPNSFLAIYVAFLTGALASLILIVWGKRSLRGGVIPFGPFLILGIVTSLMVGNIVWQEIMHFLF